MKILSLSGKKQSGKTTTARLIKDILLAYDSDLEIQILNFADSLKEEVAMACGVSLNYLESHKSNFRLILQGWGTEFRRDLVSEDYWISRLFQKIKNLDSDIIIIADVRFLNEYGSLLSVGAKMWLIKRELEFTTLDKHQSETELDGMKDWDHIIDNSKSLLELKVAIKSGLEKCGIIKY